MYVQTYLYIKIDVNINFRLLSIINFGILEITFKLGHKPKFHIEMQLHKWNITMF
jgi:hypothetical protein